MAITIHSLYGGDVQISFDEEPHIYTRLQPGPEQILVGATTKTGILDKPFLRKWYLEQAVGAVKKLVAPGTFVTEAMMNEIASAIMDTGHKTKEKAGDIGHEVHAWICSYIKSKIGFNECPALPVEFQQRNCVLAWTEWEPAGIEWLETERLVYSRKLDACGMLDEVGKPPDKIKTLFDVKTGKGIYEEYLYQAGGYYGMYNEEMAEIGGEPITRAQIVRVDKAKAKAFHTDYIDQETLEELYEHFILLHRLHAYRPKLSKKLKTLLKGVM